MAYKVIDKDGNPIKHEDKEVFGLDSVGVVKGVSMTKRTLTMVATDESKDRDGDIILAKGWDFTNYRKNPVFLWAHDYRSVPLAAAIRIVRRRVESNPTEMTHKFPTEGLNPFADMILELFNQKIINAGSVGFIPFKWDNMPKDEADPNSYTIGKMYTKQELLEHSAVPVPSNPNAIQNALKSLDQPDAVKELVLNHIAGKSTYGFTNEQEDDINNEMNEIKAAGVEFEEEKIQVQVSSDISSESAAIPAKAEEYDCECVDCGHKLKSNKHCKDLECPKCGGEMRREERPGSGDYEPGDVEISVDDAISVINDAYEAGYPIDGWIKTGAVLSGKDKVSLEKARELIQAVLKAARPIKHQDLSKHAQDNEPNAEGGVIESILELDEDKEAEKIGNLKELTSQLKTIVTAMGKI